MLTGAELVDAGRKSSVSDKVHGTGETLEGVCCLHFSSTPQHRFFLLRRLYLQGLKRGIASGIGARLLILF